MDRVLDALRCQTLETSAWELVLVDNSSRTPLSQVYDLSWHPNARHVVEAELGLTNANLRGIAESRGDLLVFVHDDTVLPPSYLANALEISRKAPCVGCFGAAKITPEFEVEPSSEVRPYTFMLALKKGGSDSWSNLPDDRFVPWGAGLCVKRQVADAYDSEMRSLDEVMRLGRKGNILVSGEDVEFSWVACQLGYAKGVFSDLEVLHLIDGKRVSPEYMERLWEGHAFSEAVLRGRRGRGVSIPVADASFASIAKAVLSLRLSHTLSEMQRWNEERNRSPFKRRLDAAWRRGLAKGLETLRM